ncbi:MAG: DeoR/GlpR transcriptional regulator [Rhizobiaceae bacterium]|nr:DeoR/GlpR transcriptional regulator [Rhizobiaceae bacterium]
MFALIKERGAMGTTELADMLGISVPTVRRDLSALEVAGLVIRTHGGVVTQDAVRESDLEPLFSDKLNVHQVLKERIAAAAAELVFDRATVIIDSGTTGLALARQLAGRSVTIVALDLKVAEAAATGSTEVLLVGGRVRNGLFNVTGAWATDLLQAITADLFFLSADAIDAEHVTNSTIEEAAVKKAAIDKSLRTVLIADHSKLNQRRFVPVCGVERVDVFVTDSGSREPIAAYESKFKKIIYC